MQDIVHKPFRCQLNFMMHEITHMKQATYMVCGHEKINN